MDYLKSDTPLSEKLGFLFRDLVGVGMTICCMVSCTAVVFAAFTANAITLSDGTFFDRTYYAQNQDVQKLVEEGKYSSYEDHFIKVGFREGRLPYEGAPDVTPARITLAVNETRQLYGLPELTTDPGLCQIAQVRADEIASAGLSCFGHTRPDGRSWTSVYDDMEYLTSSKRENLEWNEYRNNHGSREVVKAWMESPSHQQNLLDTSVTKTGTAVAKTSDGKVIVVQEFAK